VGEANSPGEGGEHVAVLPLDSQSRDHSEEALNAMLAQRGDESDDDNKDFLMQSNNQNDLDGTS